MANTPIDRESVEVLAQIFSQERDAFTAKTLLALRAALDAAEAEKQLAVIAAQEAQRERDAKVAERPMLPCDLGGDLILDPYTAETIAAAIRAQKT